MALKDTSSENVFVRIIIAKEIVELHLHMEARLAY